IQPPVFDSIPEEQLPADEKLQTIIESREIVSTAKPNDELTDLRSDIIVETINSEAKAPRDDAAKLNTFSNKTEISTDNSNIVSAPSTAFSAIPPKVADT